MNHLIETSNANLNERYLNASGSSTGTGGNIQAGSVQITPEMQQQGIQLSNTILQGLMNRESVDGCGKKPVDLGPLNKKKMDDWKACVKQKADALAAEKVLAQQAAEKASADQAAVIAAMNNNGGFASGFFSSPAGISVIVLGAGALIIGGFFLVKKFKSNSGVPAPVLAPTI